MKRPNIISLDDNKSFNELLRSTLKKYHLVTESFTDVALFLQRIKKASPDICLIELNAIRGGFDLIKVIRKNFIDLPIIVLSKRSNKNDINKALKYGASDYLQKPFDEVYFLAKLKHYFKDFENDINLPMYNIPQKSSGCIFTLDVSISAISEHGLTIISNQYIAKKSKVKINSKLLDEITGIQKTHTFFVSNSQVLDQNGMCQSIINFDKTNDPFIEQVRSWIIKNRSIVLLEV